MAVCIAICNLLYKGSILWFLYRLDNEGFFSLNEKDEIIFSKGKHKDLSLQNVRNQFPDYLDWLMDNENISPMVKMIISYDQK